MLREKNSSVMIFVCTKVVYDSIIASHIQHFVFIQNQIKEEDIKKSNISKARRQHSCRGSCFHAKRHLELPNSLKIWPPTIGMVSKVDKGGPVFSKTFTFVLFPFSFFHASPFLLHCYKTTTMKALPPIKQDENQRALKCCSNEKNAASSYTISIAGSTLFCKPIFSLFISRKTFVLVMLLYCSLQRAAVVCEEKTSAVSNETHECVCPLHTTLDPSTVTLSTSGPWGGSGGTAFYDGTASAISAVHITHGKAIYSFQTQYVIGSTLHWSQPHGSSDGELVIMNLNYEEEYIGQIKGHYGDGILPCPCQTVNSIEFKVVNSKSGIARTIGPFGNPVGTPFASPLGAKIVGFYGHAGTAIDQIGVYIHSTPQKLHCDTVSAS